MMMMMMTKVAGEQNLIPTPLLVRPHLVQMTLEKCALLVLPFLSADDKNKRYFDTSHLLNIFCNFSICRPLVCFFFDRKRMADEPDPSSFQPPRTPSPPPPPPPPQEEEDQVDREENGIVSDGDDDDGDDDNHDHENEIEGAALDPKDWRVSDAQRDALLERLDEHVRRFAQVDVELSLLKETKKKLEEEQKNLQSDVQAEMEHQRVNTLPLPLVYPDGKPRLLVYTRTFSKEAIKEEFLEKCIEGFLDDPQQQVRASESTAIVAKRMTEYVTSQREKISKDSLRVKIDNERAKNLGIPLRNGASSNNASGARQRGKRAPSVRSSRGGRRRSHADMASNLFD